jgi:hypothetical protein
MRFQKISHKTKRKNYSDSFSFQRWIRKISETKPSSLVITTILLAYSVFLFGGGVFSAVSPIFPPYTGSTFLFIYPELTSQFISETVLAPILFAMGFGGVYFLYNSTKFAYKPRQAYMNAIIGASLLLLAYIALEYFIVIKTS